MAADASATLASASVAAGGDASRDAVAEVVLHQADRHALQRLVHGGDLGQDVDAVGVLVDQPLQPTDLALDASQPGQVGGLVVVVPVVSAMPDHIPPVGMYQTLGCVIEAVCT